MEEPTLQTCEVADEPPTLIKEDLLPLTAQGKYPESLQVSHGSPMLLQKRACDSHEKEEEEKFRSPATKKGLHGAELHPPGSVSQLAHSASGLSRSQRVSKWLQMTHQGPDVFNGRNVFAFT
uniref:Uncharacterized protein n=1 Tax=Anguilla anguilla TaxID=7936 RepID=A0A0E9S8D7_ANGAN